MVDTSVKFYHSSMAAAPKFNNAAGCLVGILDACLVNGIGQQTASSAVVTAGQLVLTFPSTHSFVQYAVVRISGITDAGYTALNGDSRVGTVINATSISIDATGLSDATLASTVTCLLPPIGWKKVFADTNKAVYQSSDPTSSQMLFAFDDTAVKYTAVRGYESMTDVNTGVGQFPTTAITSTYQWYKVYDATVQGWSLFGDSKTVYFVGFTSGQYRTYAGAHGFGDYTPIVSSDAYRGFLGGNNNLDTYNTPYASNVSIGVADGSYSFLYSPRSYNTLPNAPALLRQRWNMYNFNGNDYGTISGCPGMPWPNPIDGGLFLTEIYLTEGSNMRGRMRGVFATPQGPGRNLAHGTIFTNINGRNYIYMWNCGNGSGGGIFFDITGPWA